MSFFNRLRNFGRKVLQGAGRVGRKVLQSPITRAALGGLGQARDFVKDQYSKLKNVPVLGNVLDFGLNRFKPFLGKGALDLANIGDNVLTAAQRGSMNNWSGAKDSLRRIKLKKGGVVNKDMLETGSGSNLRIRQPTTAEYPKNTTMPYPRPNLGRFIRPGFGGTTTMPYPRLNANNSAGFDLRNLRGFRPTAMS